MEITEVIKVISKAMIIIDFMLAPNQIIIIGPNETLGKLFKTVKKGSTILADCLLDQREYNGRTYKDYTARVFSVLGADTPVKMTGLKRTKDATVEPENPYSGFTDVSRDDLPF